MKLTLQPLQPLTFIKETKNFEILNITGGGFQLSNLAGIKRRAYLKTWTIVYYFVLYKSRFVVIMALILSLLNSCANDCFTHSTSF